MIFTASLNSIHILANYENKNGLKINIYEQIKEIKLTTEHWKK